MDAASKKKALFRAKLEARNKDKNARIDSPLVRYNESDQPVCRLCQRILTSESDWKAHQVSSKHQRAVDAFKANAAAARLPRSDEPPLKPLANPPTSSNTAFPDPALLPSVSPVPVSSGSLPQDFFDNRQDLKRQKTGAPRPSNKVADTYLGTRVDRQKDGAEMLPGGKHIQSNVTDSVSDSKVGKGALPAGFFDNKDADLRARGVEPVKPNPKDEYKEFEKSIQEDLKEVDNRMEEEEYDAAETIEVAESLEQKLYKERVEMLQRKKIELRAARSAPRKAVDEVNSRKTSKEESSTDDEEDEEEEDTDEKVTVDWRAQHL